MGYFYGVYFICNKGIMQGTGAVSYTHLDVYKRQDMTVGLIRISNINEESSDR